MSINSTSRSLSVASLVCACTFIETGHYSMYILSMSGIVDL